VIFSSVGYSTLGIRLLGVFGLLAVYTSMVVRSGAFRPVGWRVWAYDSGVGECALHGAKLSPTVKCACWGSGQAASAFTAARKQGKVATGPPSQGRDCSASRSGICVNMGRRKHHPASKSRPLTQESPNCPDSPGSVLLEDMKDEEVSINAPARAIRVPANRISPHSE